MLHFGLFFMPMAGCETPACRCGHVAEKNILHGERYFRNDKYSEDIPTYDPRINKSFIRRMRGSIFLFEPADEMPK